MGCKNAVLVVGACILIVPQVDDASTYKDVVDSILLAQLVANKKLEKDPEVDWYDAYAEFLDGYWLRYVKARQEWAVGMDEVQSPGDWIAGSLTHKHSDGSDCVSATIQQIAQLSGTEPALQMLRGHMQSGKHETLDERSVYPTRLLVVQAHTPGAFTSAYVEFKACQPLELNPLAQQYRREDLAANVILRYAQSSLSAALYDPVRNSIISKLQGRYEGNVATLALVSAGQDRESGLHA